MATKKSSVKNNDMAMKMTVFIGLVIAFAAGYLVARATYKPQMADLNKMINEKVSEIKKMKADANKILMKDGEMWMVEDGLVKPMESDIMMPNGIKVTQEGKVIGADSEETMMENGDAMDMDGNMMPNGGAEVQVGSPSF